MYDHIIMISLDTLRSDCISLNPCKLWHLKYNISSKLLKDNILNQIASKGFFFTNCISAAPYTSASHASYFTGKWPINHGIYEFFNKGLKSKTLFHYAQKKGYTTNFKTDFPIILGNYLGFHHNIDNYIIENDNDILNCIKNNDKTFNFIHFGGLHIPYGFHNLNFGGNDYKKTILRHEEIIPHSDGNPADKLVETYRSSEDLDLLLRYKKIIQHYYSIKDYDHLFTMYLEGINYFFENRFTAFFENLQKICKGKKTLIVIFGDHGEEYDEQSYGHHNSLAEGVIRVPLIFLANDIEPGVDHNRIRTIDMAPTLLEIMGYNLSSIALDGASLRNVICDNQKHSQINHAFSQAYTSETSEFVEFQQRLLRTKRKTGSLKHYLYKEAVYADDLKLHRQHYSYTENGGIWGMQKIEPQTTLEIIDGSLIPKQTKSNKSIEVLETLLAKYNSVKNRGGPKVNPTNEMRMQLRAMGYNV